MQEPAARNGTHLAPDMIARYWEDGFLFPIDVLSRDEAQTYRTQLEWVERDWLEGDLPLPLNTYKRVNAQLVMPFVHEIATKPQVLDVIEGILGPDILIYSAEFFIKNAQSDQYVSMHQDLTYWGMGTTPEMVTAWIALSPATRASGCMDFVKGSHKSEILPHTDTFNEKNLLSRGQEIAVDVAEEDKTAIELMPGQMSLHHGLTIHGSGPNISDDRRIAVVVRYVTPQVAQNMADRDYAMLARGIDRVGKFIHYTAPQTLFEPRAVDLYDEIRQARAKAMMAGAKAQKGIYA
ncbi:phytanoyl-CoA dioxygenase family protein [Rhodobacterales bacterium LSUCC1028]|nr:phytanoyl-CoA dioxygenase family protein [Rhodobacterales bacterium LSUCC1028]